MSPDSAAYCGQVSKEHRQKHGQFFTHPQAARFMADWALQSGVPELFDPAVGLGAFFAPVADAENIQCAGSEIDAAIINFWRTDGPRQDAKVVHENYLLSWGAPHGNIVCNPPYMRFQKFIGREQVFRAFQRHLGLKLSGYTNIASAFLLKSIAELREAGRLAYIMPLEFLNTGYGKVVKQRLIEKGHLAAIISVNCEKEVFPEAITSVGIVLYDAARHHSSVKFYTIDSVDELADVLRRVPITEVPVGQLNPAAKWLSYFSPSKFTVEEDLLAPLSDYGHFSRGIATGANEFFVLTPSEAKLLDIGLAEAVPCVARSSQVKGASFSQADYENLAEANAPVLLFRAADTPSDGACNYIWQGEQKGYNRRFITKTRRPWYKVEQRSPAPILLGVFSRGGYKVIRNDSGAVNLTCFHGFHPNFFGVEYVDRLFLYLASNPGRSIMALSARRYGDSLDKFEPNDLNGALAPCPQLLDQLPAGDVARALSCTRETGKTPKWVDDFFEVLRTPIGPAHR